MNPHCAGTELDAHDRLKTARAVIARELLDVQQPPMTLGEITLHPHQQRAVARLTSIIGTHGGALLADPTGLGKSFVALGVARNVKRLVIACPAAIRGTWQQALDRTQRVATIVSLERLGRGAPSLVERPELVIVDESHHLRNPNTNRYAAAAALCDRASVLLLSATPIQNRRDDLVAQLALFLGDTAKALADHELSRVIVRRAAAESSARLPIVDGPHWIALDAEDDVLDAILDLPPAVPLADEGEAHTLVRYTLLRQWSSSRAALVSGLRGRLARGVALLAAIDAGRRPTRQELRAWSHTDDAVQLAIPELLAAPLGDAETADTLRAAIESHVAGVRALLDRLRHLPDPDPARVDALRALRSRHRDARIIAFSQYAQTVRCISQLLMRRDGGVAELTARGGRVAGGRIGRAEALSQFSPRTPAVAAADRIDLLVTTDVSSEGLDLQMASVIVHLDLPWNPARLEQRVGRVCRLGAAHERVFVYALAPPAPAERVLAVEARLRAKLHVAAQLVGVGRAALLSDVGAGDASPTASTSELYAILERWRNQVDCPSSIVPAVAAVRASFDGCLGLFANAEERLLVGDEGSGLTLDPGVVTRLATLAFGVATTPRADDMACCAERLEKWWRHHVAREQLGRLGVDGTLVRARIAALMAILIAAAPRHTRAELTTRVATARQVLRLPLGIGAERRLTELARASKADEQWLGQLMELAANRSAAGRGHDATIVAMILFCREDRDGPIQR